jgi:hypothetical protein
MDCRDGCAWTLVIAAAAILGSVVSSGVVAQTLNDPHPKTNVSSTTVTTKSRPTAHLKNCSIYGPGFVVVTGSDMCMKVGGGVTAEFGH